MVRHGGCLGLGLAAMGTSRQDVYEQLKLNLYEDDAVTGRIIHRDLYRHLYTATFTEHLCSTSVRVGLQYHH